MRSNLPQKISKVLSEPKFGPPQSKIPGSAPLYVTWFLFLLFLLLIIIINLLYLRKFIYSSKSFEPIIIKNISVYKIIVYYVWIVVWWKQRQKHHCLPNIEPAKNSALCQDTSGGLVRSHINENGTLRLFRYFFKKLPQDCSFRGLYTIMESQVIYNQESQIAANPAEINFSSSF